MSLTRRFAEFSRQLLSLLVAISLLPAAGGANVGRRANFGGSASAGSVRGGANPPVPGPVVLGKRATRAWQAAGQETRKDEMPESAPLSGYRRANDRVSLECVNGYWHEITYAFYFATSEKINTILIKIGDKDTGERCFISPPQGTVKNDTSLKLKSLQCINGYWYEVIYVLYQPGDPRNPSKDKPLWVKLSESTTGRACSVTIPKPNPEPGTATPPDSPCDGGVLGTSRARSECNPDGFWHVVTDEEWICPPDWTKKQFKRDKATNQPCRPGQAIPPGLPGAGTIPEPVGPSMPATPQGGSGQAPGGTNAGGKDAKQGTPSTPGGAGTTGTTTSATGGANAAEQPPSITLTVNENRPLQAPCQPKGVCDKLCDDAKAAEDKAAAAKAEVDHLAGLVATYEKLIKQTSDTLDGQRKTAQAYEDQGNKQEAAKVSAEADKTSASLLGPGGLLDTRNDLQQKLAAARTDYEAKAKAAAAARAACDACHPCPDNTKAAMKTGTDMKAESATGPAQNPQQQNPPLNAPQTQSVPAGGNPLPDLITLQSDQALMDRVKEESRQIKGDTDPNGTRIAPVVKEALVLVRNTYVEQIRTQIKMFEKLEKASDQEIDALVIEMASNAPEVLAAANELFGYLGKDGVYHEGAQPNPWRPGDAVWRQQYENLLKEADDAEKRGDREWAANRRGLAADSAWAHFLAARQKFYQALDKSPLLALKDPDFFSWTGGLYMYQILTQQPRRDPEKIRESFRAAVKAAKQNAQQELRTTHSINTVGDMWKFGSPQFQRQQAIAAGLGGINRDYINALQGAHYAYSANKKFLDSSLEFMVDMASQALLVGAMVFLPIAAPFVLAGITAIQIKREGEDFIIAYLDEKQAAAAANATGGGYVFFIDPQDRQREALNRGFVTVGIAVAGTTLGELFAAWRAGKVKVVVPSIGYGPAEAAIAQEFGDEVARGVAAARRIGISEEEISRQLANSRVTGKLQQTGVPELEKQNLPGLEVVQGAAAARKLIASLADVDEIIAAAQQEGVSEKAIQDALAVARQTGTIAGWTKGLSRDLLMAKLNQDGGIILIRGEDVAELNEWVNSVRPKNVEVFKLQEPAGDYDLVAGKIHSLTGPNATTMTLEPHEWRVINEIVKRSDLTKLYQFDPESGTFTRIFKDDFLRELRQFLERQATLGNEAAKTALGELDFAHPELAAQGNASEQLAIPPGAKQGTVPLTLEDATKRFGQLQGKATRKVSKAQPRTAGSLPALQLTPEQVLGMSDEQLLNMSLEKFNSLPLDTRRAIIQELQRRFPPGAAGGAGGTAIAGPGATGGALSAAAAGAAAGPGSQGCQQDMEGIMACRRQCDSMCREASESSETQKELNRLNARLGLGGDIEEAKAQASALNEAAANAPEGTSFEERRRLDEAADQAQQKLDELLGPLNKQRESLTKKLSEELERCLRECYQKCVLCPVETPLQMRTGTTGKSDATPASGPGDATDRATGGGEATPAANPGTPLWPRPMQDFWDKDSLDRMKKRLRILEGGSPEERYEELSRRSENSKAGLTAKSAEDLSDHDREQIAKDFEKLAEIFAREGDKKKADLHRRIVAKLRSPGGCATSATQTATGYLPTKPQQQPVAENAPGANAVGGGNVLGGGPTGVSTTAPTAAMNAPSSSASTGTTGAGSFLSITSGVAGLINTGFSAPVALFEQNLTIAQQLDYTFNDSAPASSGSPGATAVASLKSDLRDGFPLQRLGARLQPVALRMGESFLTFSSPLAMRGAIEEDSWSEPPGEITYSLVANGNSSGEALELQVFDPSGRIKRVDMPEGMVLEPLKMGAAQPVAARAPRGANLLTKQLTAYCVDYLKLPPQVGMLYRVAPQAVQDKFKPIAAVLRAGRELAAKGQLHPDSHAKAYNDSIRQYSLWTKLENWGQEKFGEVFLEKTKQNAVSAKVKWTKQMEQAVRGLVPGRWRDISMVLDQAAKLSSASQIARPPQ